MEGFWDKSFSLLDSLGSSYFESQVETRPSSQAHLPQTQDAEPTQDVAVKTEATSVSNTIINGMPDWAFYALIAVVVVLLLLMLVLVIK